ncbi:hypothetical protein [Saccharothrix lopnurensis]|uniref:Uncharacterized protein n=1 Tax=Saccharothrix lopnurensis TaxID=1670621 RepID=A0ABW1PGF5_9PSEU
MNDRITALLRTVVPAAWGTGLAWLVGRGLLTPGQALDAAPLGLQLVDLVAAPVAIAAVYAASRWLETRSWMPAWLTRVLLGSVRQPSYSGMTA